MSQKVLQEDKNTENDLSCFLPNWRQDGINPLVMVKGYSELLLDNGIGNLNNSQIEVMQKIFDLSKEAINSWHKFTDYFYLNSSDREPISPAEINPIQFKLLREKIIDPALTTLQKIGEYSDALLKEKFGILTNEQREALDIIHRYCVLATQRWDQPINYFKRYAVNNTIGKE